MMPDMDLTKGIILSTTTIIGGRQAFYPIAFAFLAILCVAFMAFLHIKFKDFQNFKVELHSSIFMPNPNPNSQPNPRRT